MKNDQIKKLNSEVTVLKDRIGFMEKLNQELVDQNKQLLSENDKLSELMAFLPSGAMNQLNRKDTPTSSLRYKMVTVLYSDVKGFTKLSEEQDANALVDGLDNFFFHFDDVVARHSIEKIKSIGDTFMCAGGIPRKNRTNPIEVILAALEMQQFLKKMQDESKKNDDKIWDLTFGVHTGPVTATITGKKKKSYDIKGDTVNIASRIEAACIPGEISISAMTYEFVREYFSCKYHSKMPVKYKGGIAIYSVTGIRPELSVNGAGQMPNDEFRLKLQLIRFDDLNDYILDRLERELPKHLYYHDLKHTIDVTIMVEIIGESEGVTKEEMLLLKTAGVFHDFGQVKGASGHEERSCQYAREILPRFSYTPEQIETIEGIIMATQLPPRPSTHLQRIICDADLDYLGRSDFVPVSDKLAQELKVQGIIGDINEWNKMQVKFLSGHQFFTDTAKNMRRVNKKQQIERLKSLIIED